MLLFLLALIVSGLGVAAYAHYDPGAHDVNFPNFHFSAVPDWVTLAIAAGVPLFLFLLNALFAPRRARS